MKNISTITFFLTLFSISFVATGKDINYKELFHRKDALCDYGYTRDIGKITSDGWGYSFGGINRINSGLVESKYDFSERGKKLSLKSCVPVYTNKEKDRPKYRRPHLDCGSYTGYLSEVFHDGRGLISYKDNGQYFKRIIKINECRLKGKDIKVSKDDFINVILENMDCSKIPESDCKEIKQLGESAYLKKNDKIFWNKFPSCEPFQFNIYMLEGSKPVLREHRKIIGIKNGRCKFIHWNSFYGSYQRNCSFDSKDIFEELGEVATKRKLGKGESLLIYTMKNCTKEPREKLSKSKKIELENKIEEDKKSYEKSLVDLEEAYNSLKIKCRSGDKEACDTYDMAKKMNEEMCKKGQKSFCEMVD